MDKPTGSKPMHYLDGPTAWILSRDVAGFDATWEAGEQYGWHDSIGGSEYVTALTDFIIARIGSEHSEYANALAEQHTELVVADCCHQHQANR